MKKIFAIFAVVFGVSTLAHAGILVEPYLGYETGDAKYTYAVGGQSGTDGLSGASLGLRLGYKLLLPWIALDYTGVTGTDKRDTKFFSKDADYTQTGLGAVVGVDLPLIRAWAGYGFSNQLTVSGAAGAADTKFKGTYVKAGVGLGFIPFVSINLEYKINNYNKVDIGSGEVERADAFSELKHDTLMVSVSLPFNL